MNRSVATDVAATVSETTAFARPSPWRVWLLATRPATLPAAVVPVAVGTAVAAAEGGVHVVAALAALAGALLLQIGCNLVNDVEDFARGADTAARLGPARATQRGWLTAAQVRRAAALAFGLALLVGAGLTWHAGWPVAAIGVAGLFAAVAYTAGPWPLGYLGLGDVLVFAFFGPVAVCGTVWVQLGRVPVTAALASLSIGALATAVLVVNNLRDRDGDARAGKRTLAVRWGATAARAEYLVLLAAAFAVPASVVALGVGRLGWLAPLLALPAAAVCARAILRTDGAALNPWLGRTARLEALFGLLLAAGMLAP